MARALESCFIPATLEGAMLGVVRMEKLQLQMPLKEFVVTAELNSLSLQPS